MAIRFHSIAVRVNGKTDRTKGVMPTTTTIRTFHKDLIRWYQRYHRKLPWRATRDPYKIWVSEIMLQQTRVETVLPYYRRWIRAFPTCQVLARAPFSRVLRLWEGLGYYRRARNLHQAAKLIRAGARPSTGPRHGRKRTDKTALPSTVPELLRLPGIGRYTAGAIASIAFGQVVPLVDGNVARVLARVFGIRSDVTKPAIEKQLWALAAELLPTDNAGTFNQSLMELGALICTPSRPRCSSCPMNRVCVAHATGEQDELPNRGARPANRKVAHDVALVRRGNRLLLNRRPSDGLLAGLWELPPLEDNRVRLQQPLLTIHHTITNHRITLRIFECAANEIKPPSKGSLRWVTSADLMEVTLPAAHRRAVVRILGAQFDRLSRSLPTPLA